MDGKSKLRIGLELILVIVLGVGIFKVYDNKKNNIADEDNVSEQEPAKEAAKFIREKRDTGKAKKRVFGKEQRLAVADEVEDSAVELSSVDEDEFADFGLLVAFIRDGQGQPYQGTAEIVSGECAVKSVINDGEIAIELAPGVCEFYVQSLSDPSLVSQKVNVTVRSGETSSTVFNFPAAILSSVGLVLSAGEAWQEVREVIPAGPAALAGLEVGDIIIEISGRDVSLSTANDAMGLLAGPANTTVEVVIAVEGDKGWEGIPVTLTRDANY